MSTNYYMNIANQELVYRYFPDEYEIVEYPFLSYEIHIGKRSIGWKPLFQVHEKAYQSVSEMKKFIREHQSDIKIFDEYKRELTLDELEDELINWAEHQQVRYMKYVPEGVCIELFGREYRDYLIKSTVDDYDIRMPYDHLEYHKLNPYGEDRSLCDSSMEPLYIHDKDGYDFMRGDFC